VHFNPEIIRNGERKRREGFREDLSFEEAMTFMDESGDKPFFYMNRIVTVGSAVILLVMACTRTRETTSVEERSSRTETSQPLRLRDYSLAWWPDGFRKEKADDSADVLCVESGQYGITLDMADFTKARLGRIDGIGYLSASRTGASALPGLHPAEFKIELEHQSKVYRALDCLDLLEFSKVISNHSE